MSVFTVISGVITAVKNYSAIQKLLDKVGDLGTLVEMAGKIDFDQLAKIADMLNLDTLESLLNQIELEELNDIVSAIDIKEVYELAQTGKEALADGTLTEAELQRMGQQLIEFLNN